MQSVRQELLLPAPRAGKRVPDKEQRKNASIS